VALEIFFMRISDGDVLYRVAEENVTQSQEDPMEIAKRLARQESESGDEAAFVHSSSWRYEAPGRVVLTYVDYSERFELDGARRMPLGDLDAREGRSETTANRT
jgi:hypothetical protein